MLWTRVYFVKRVLVVLLLAITLKSSNNEFRTNHRQSFQISNQTTANDWNVLNDVIYRNSTMVRGKIAWVISASSSAIEKYKYELSSINCYGAFQNIPIFIEPLLYSKVRHRDYCQNRLNNLFKYLPYYDWLFVSDADVIIANYSKNLMDYVDIYKSQDIVLQFRDDIHEVFAGSFFVRNSPHGFEFLRRWLNISSDQRDVGLNSDNGDLLELLGQYAMNNFTSRPCDPYRIADWGWLTYKNKFLNCTLGSIDRLADENREYDKNGVNIGPIRIFREYLGFARTFRYVGIEEMTRNEMTTRSSTSCLMVDVSCKLMKGDFLLHAKENKDLWKYLLVSYVACTIDTSKQSDFEYLDSSFKGFTGHLSVPIEYWIHDTHAMYLSEMIWKKPFHVCQFWNSTNTRSICALDNAMINSRVTLGPGIATAPDGKHFWVEHGMKRPMSESVYQFLSLRQPHLQEGYNQWTTLPLGDPLDNRLKNDSLYTFSSHISSKRVFWLVDGVRRPIRNGSVFINHGWEWSQVVNLPDTIDSGDFRLAPKGPFLD